VVDGSTPVVVAEVTAVAVDMPSHSTRVEWFEAWEEKTREAQNAARRDRDYYDNKQWTPDEIRALEERNQPVLTKNRIARKVNFILGEEIRKRVDPVARPRTPQHEDASRAATDALRYVEEEQEFDVARSAVLKNMLIEGYGGAIKELEDCGDGEFKHRLTHVEWDRLFYDPSSRRPDFGDAKYKGIVLWMDLDDALLEYPDAAEALQVAVNRNSVGSADITEDTPRRWVDTKRKRVKIVEMYFRIGRDWFRSDFTQGADLLGPEPTAYMDEKGQHSVCPLEMVSCYVDSDGMRYGVVRQLISPQDEVNKRASKALHLLSVRQVIAERDFIRDPHKFQTELAKPDGFAEVEPGALNEGRVQVSQTGDLAQGQVALLEQAKMDIDAIGPSSSTLPDLPDSSSGRAFIARQQAASQELGAVFDALRSWTRAVFKLDWLCIRQYWTEEKWLRVTDDQELTGYRFVALNRQMTRSERLQELLEKQPKPPLPKAVEIAAGTIAPLVIAEINEQHQAMMQQAQQAGAQPPQGPELEAHMLQMFLAHPLMQEPVTVNQVDTMLVDIILDEAPETAVLAQEEFQTLTELLPTVVQSRPDMAPAMARLVVKASQLPNKRELLQELDKGPDPQQMQMQAQQAQLAMAQQQAGLQVAQSQAQLNAARAASEQAKTELAGAKVPSEIEKNQAQAMRDAAAAGEKTGGMTPPMGAPQWPVQ
jgi:hypothetical protein